MQGVDFLAVLVLLALAVARLTQAIVDDKIFEFLRKWAIVKFGEESLRAYFVHCVACTSFWVALIAGLYACLFLGLSWFLFVPVWFALSYLTILLNDLRGS